MTPVTQGGSTLIINERVDSYHVSYAANTFRPRIGIRHGDIILGQCVFLPNGTTLPQDFLRPNGQADIHYHLDDFANVIDLLRHEDSVYFRFSGVGAENGLSTRFEPIGEAEGRSTTERGGAPRL